MAQEVQTVMPAAVLRGSERGMIIPNCGHFSPKEQPQKPGAMKPVRGQAD
jgi:hypothetical protein